jgi:hypothetical protein
MLVYHPAFDLYNCIYRLLQLLTLMKQSEIEVDRIRIWDFYLTFPREARKIKFPQDLAELKKVFKDSQPNPYEDLIDSKKIFERMKSYQMDALKCLASYDFIERELLNDNIVKRTSKEIPAALVEYLTDLSIEKENIIKLVTGFHDLPLVGGHGLKSRTGLLDFKYDVA